MEQKVKLSKIEGSSASAGTATLHYGANCDGHTFKSFLPQIAMDLVP